MKSIIGVSTWSLQQLSFTKGASLEDIIDMVAEMGAEGIDICEEYIPCHPLPDPVNIHKIRKKIEEKGLLIGATWFGTEVHEAIKASSMEFTLDAYRKNIHIAREMGSRNVCIPMLADLKHMTREEVIKEYITFFEQLLPYAEEYRMPLTHECAREKCNGIALEIAKYFNSPYYTVCPDLEAWRFGTPDLPLGPHCEDPDGPVPTPEPISLFRELMPYSPYIHFKLLSLDENGEEPHFPIAEMMDCINSSSIDHYLCVEYEGWIPEIHPERDSYLETKRCVEMIQRYQKF